jgi:hypothetical protein
LERLSPAIGFMWATGAFSIVSDSLRTAELDSVEHEARRAQAAEGIGIVSRGDQSVPEILVIAGDVHFGHGSGEFAFFDQSAVHAEREIAGCGVRMLFWTGVNG